MRAPSAASGSGIDEEDVLAGPSDSGSYFYEEYGAPMERQLSMYLEESFFRGVSLTVALSRWGLHWAVPAQSSNEKQSRKNFDLSFQIWKYNYFLSHDWQTSRWMKFMTMLLVFNLPAATVVTMIFVVSYGQFGPWRMHLHVRRQEAAAS